MSGNITQAFLKDINEFFYGGNHWQAGLFQLVSPLSSEQALWKPSPERHCIWEVLRHVNFWKTQAMANFLDKYSKENTDEGNWSQLPADTSEESWKKELEFTRTLQDDILGLVSGRNAGLFDTADGKSNYLRQIFFHDAYHSGQIGLLRVMQGLKPIE